MNGSKEIPEDTVNCCPQCGKYVPIELADSSRDSLCPHCDHLLWFLWRPVGEVVVLTFLPGLMSGSESMQRLDEVRSILGSASHVLVNLTHMQFISSLFLGMLIVLYRRVLSAGGELKICGVHAAIAEIFQITKLDEVFEIFSDEPSALRSLSGSAG